MVVAGLGAGAWFLLPRSSGAVAAKAVAVEPTVKATVPLGAVVVNLGGETRRYLRVGRESRRAGVERREGRSRTIVRSSWTS